MKKRKHEKEKKKKQRKKCRKRRKSNKVGRRGENVHEITMSTCQKEIGKSSIMTTWRIPASLVPGNLVRLLITTPTAIAKKKKAGIL